MVKGVIKILDINFNLLGEIDEYSSLQWCRKWHKPGDFELHLSASSYNVDKLVKDNILLLDGMKNKLGIIRHRELSQEDTEKLVVKGSMLSSLVDRRITIPPEGMAYDIINDIGESVMKHYVDVNCINPVDINRKIPNLDIAPNQYRGSQIKWQSRLKQLDGELEKISLATGLGWDITLDIEKSKLQFEIFEGRDLTADQELYPPVIFSIDFDNINKQQYVESSFNHKNVGYVGGQGEGEDRYIVEVGEISTGLNRIETFIDARDISKEEDLYSRGLQKLNEFREIKTFENSVIPYGSFNYEVDWDLGDIVTIQNKNWDATINARITEVKEIYESSGFNLEVTFGSNIPTLIDKIKKELDTPLIEKATTNNIDITEIDGGSFV